MHTGRARAKSRSCELGMLWVQLGFSGIPGFLALVQALIGGLHEFGGGKAVGRVDGKTNADGDRRRVGLQTETTADALGDVLRAFAVGVQGTHQGEDWQLGGAAF